MKQSSHSSVRVIVELQELNNEDVMIFNMDEDENKYVIYMNRSSGQAEMKDVFTKLLELLMNNNVTVELKIADGYAKGLYKEVCSEYVSELNRELIQVKTSMEELLK